LILPETNQRFEFLDLTNADTSTINAQLLNATLKIIKNDTTVEQTASLFAKINVAQYDSAVAGWQQKYKYLFWRPITALR
jgi:hypothetical protein